MTYIFRGFSVDIMGFLFPSRHYRHDHIQQIWVSGLFGAIAVMYGTQQCVSQQKTLILKAQSGSSPTCSGWVSHWGWFSVSTGPGLGKERCLLFVLVVEEGEFSNSSKHNCIMSWAGFDSWVSRKNLGLFSGLRCWERAEVLQAMWKRETGSFW